uniref:Translational activator of cytochrome c oxidase 1 n=1 Tax=Cacopsylla melanoneura TaxID=428564 RepID=A0A8D8VVH9_9HEMI
MNNAIKCIQNAHLLRQTFKLNVGSINNNILTTHSVRFKGHSKWQNIRAIKFAKDQERSLLFTQLLKKLKMAIQEGGGSDPKTNYRLASMIEYCKKQSMPMSTIENAIKTTQKDQSKMQVIQFEIRGPRNAMIIVNTLAANKGHIRTALAPIVRKCPIIKWLEGGSGLSKFDIKGQIYAKIPPGMNNPEETTVDDGIELGVEEVNKSEVEEDHYEFITAPQDLMPIKTKLEKKNYEIVRADIEYIPNELAVLDETELEKITAVYAKLEAIPEVVHIYDNIECSS